MSVNKLKNGARILKLAEQVEPLLQRNDRATARQRLEEILSLEVVEDDVPAIQQKEAAVYKLTKLLILTKDVERLIQLLQHEVRPLFSLLPKVKATKIMRTLFDAIMECRVHPERQEMVCRDSIEWARREKRTFLRHRLELRLVEMVFKRRAMLENMPSSPASTGSDGSSLPPAGSSLREAMLLAKNLLKELRRLDDRSLLLEAHLLESQIYYASRNIPKARAALVCARTAASSIYCSPLSQAQIDLQSGLIHLDEHDYRTASSYFYEAFEGFHNLGDEAKPARLALRYLLLSKIFSGSKEDVDALLRNSHILEYGGSELKTLRAISDAYFRSDTHLFNQILQEEQSRAEAKSAAAKNLDEYSPSVLQDEVVHRQLTEMYDALTERHLLKLILPYHRVQIDFLADVLGQDRQEVEHRISQLILDKKINGIVDQELRCLCIFDDAEDERIRRKQLNKSAKHEKAATVVASGGAPSAAGDGSSAPNQLSANQAPPPTSLFDDALEAIGEYDKLVTALFDKIGGKFDSIVEATREAREARKKAPEKKEAGDNASNTDNKNAKEKQEEKTELKKGKDE